MITDGAEARVEQQGAKGRRPKECNAHGGEAGRAQPRQELQQSERGVGQCFRLLDHNEEGGTATGAGRNCAWEVPGMITGQVSPLTVVGGELEHHALRRQRRGERVTDPDRGDPDGIKLRDRSVKASHRTRLPKQHDERRVTAKSGA